MNILITGPLGHIGSRLIHDLSFTNGFEKIYLVDNLSTQRYSTLLKLSKNKFFFHELDVRDDKIVDLVKQVDIVLHLAAITNATETIGQRDKVINNNLISTKNLTNLCLGLDKHLIFVSSTSVYGIANSIVDEETVNLAPQTPYAESKLLEEQYIQESILKGLRAHILRFGTIYGTSVGMRFHTAVNKFCFDAILNKKINIWRSAFNQRRPYLYLNDALQAIKMAITFKVPVNNLYNVVTENLTVNQVISSIRRQIPNLNLNFVEDVILNQHSYEVDFRKISKFGYTPSGNINSGVKEIISNLEGIVNYKFDNNYYENKYTM